MKVLTNRSTQIAGLLLALGLIGWVAIQAPVTRPEPDIRVRLSETYGKLPMSFEPNHGLTDEPVKFLSRGHGYKLFLTPTEAVLALRKPQAKESAADHQLESVEETERKLETVLKIKLVGANPQAHMAGVEELPGKVNYFIGNDPTQWRTNVPT